MKGVVIIFLLALVALTSRAQNLPQSFPEVGLIAWYPFNGGASDLSGHGSTAVVVGDVVLTKDRFGNASSAYAFSGKPNSKIRIVMKKPVLLKSRTFACWIKFPKVAKTWYPSIFSTLQGGDYAHILGNHPSYESAKTVGKLYWSWMPGRAGIYSNHFFNDDKWHHVAMVADHDTHTYAIYCDGQLDSSVTAENTTLVVDSMAFAYQSANDVNSSCVGSLDDFAIYDRALSADEIHKLFQAGTPDNHIENNFSVIPDAERQELIVTIVAGAYDTYTITDKTGKALMKQFIKDSETKIDISMLKPGIYNLTLEKDGRQKRVTFVTKEQGVLK